MSARDDFGSASGRGRSKGRVSDIENAGVARRKARASKAQPAPRPSPRPVAATPVPASAPPPVPQKRPAAPIPNMRPPVQSAGVGPLPPVNYANRTNNLPNYSWNSGYRQNPNSPGGVPYRERDDLYVEPGGTRLRRHSDDEHNAQRHGDSLASASGYNDIPWYTPVPGMGPMPYDPRYSPPIDPHTGRPIELHRNNIPGLLGTGDEEY